jgi:hypothetical protein
MSRPSTFRTWVPLRYSTTDLDSEGLPMSATLTESMNLCNKVFISERVSMLASIFAKTEDI